MTNRRLILAIVLAVGAVLATAFASARAQPQTGVLAYVASGALFVVNSDETNPHQIARIPQGVEHPSWSPDGRHLVFSDYAPGYPAKSCVVHGLWVVDADGSNLHRLFKGCVKQPSWSPDGTKIAVAMRLKYAANRDADTAIAVLNADGTHRQRLTQLQASASFLKRAANWVNDVTPAWSPDGSTILYATRGAEGDFHLALVHLDGTPAGGFNPPDGTFDAFPAFSPDGSSIVFARRAANNEVTDPWQIVVSRPDGSAASVIGAGGTEPTTPSVPAWSPDGARIAWSTDHGLTIAAPDGSKPVAIDLPSGGAQGFEPTWQPLR